jgi:hypothetical protein
MGMRRKRYFSFVIMPTYWWNKIITGVAWAAGVRVPQDEGKLGFDPDHAAVFPQVNARGAVYGQAVFTLFV